MSKAIAGFVIIILFIAVYLTLYWTGLSDKLFNSQNLQSILTHLDSVGPLLIILLMISAIVMSPLPSAPIAIASGFAYGHSWGTIYILIGAELGAIIAFSISRLLGFETIQKRFGDKLDSTWLNSTNHLFMAVFISRLIPFISFDIISYAAGLTKISYIRFAIATFLGILPVSFLLAHFGSEMTTSDLNSMMLTILILGLLTIIPIIYSFILKRKYKK